MKLTNRAGLSRETRVTVHAPIHRKGLTACGLSLASLRAQDYPEHQPSPSADLSDVTCPLCLATVRQARAMGATAVYPTACTSAYCGRGDCAGCSRLPALLVFELWRQLYAAECADAIWCPSVYRATAAPPADTALEALEDACILDPEGFAS